MAKLKTSASELINDAIDQAKEFGMEGKYTLKKSNLAYALIPKEQLGAMGQIIESAHYVVNVSRDHYAKTEQYIANFGIHWKINGRSSKDTKKLHIMRFTPNNGKWTMVRW